MKRILSLVGLLLALAMLIAACGTAAPSRPESDEATQIAMGLITPEPTNTEVPPTPTEVVTEEPTEVPATATEVPPTEAPTEVPPTATEAPLVSENPTAVPSGNTPSEEVIAANVALADAANGQNLVNVVAPPCMSCHNFTSEAQLVGPGLYNFRDRAGTRVEGEGELTYAYNSIRYSQAHIVEGFVAGLMPSYDGVLTDEEVYDIIAYLWTLHD